MENKLDYNLVADFFIAFSNETQNLITNLKLQKLMYYAQAWHITLRGGELISEDFEAWVHGPVLPALYGKYKHFGWKPIEREDLDEKALEDIMNKLGEVKLTFLNEIIDEYFSLTAYELEKLTHREDPWIIARNGVPMDTPSNAVIDKKNMSKFYSKFVEHGEG